MKGFVKDIEGRAARLARNSVPRFFLSGAIERTFHAVHEYRAGLPAYGRPA